MRAGGYLNKVNEDMVKDFEYRYNKGDTITSIANEYNLADKTVRYHLEKNGMLKERRKNREKSHKMMYSEYVTFSRKNYSIHKLLKADNYPMRVDRRKCISIFNDRLQNVWRDNGYK